MSSVGIVSVAGALASIAALLVTGICFFLEKKLSRERLAGIVAAIIIISSCLITLSLIFGPLQNVPNVSPTPPVVDRTVTKTITLFPTATLPVSSMTPTHPSPKKVSKSMLTPTTGVTMTPTQVKAIPGPPGPTSTATQGPTATVPGPPGPTSTATQGPTATVPGPPGPTSTATLGPTATPTPCPTPTATPGETITVTDDMQGLDSPNYCAIYYYRVDWTGAAAQSEVLFVTTPTINGDSTFAERNPANMFPAIIWRCSNITAFKVVTYFNSSDSVADFTFQQSTSPIDTPSVSWVAIAGSNAPVTYSQTDSPGWTSRTYSLTSLPSGVNDIEMVWGTNPQATTNLTPLIGRVIMTCNG